MQPSPIPIPIPADAEPRGWREVSVRYPDGTRGYREEPLPPDAFLVRVASLPIACPAKVIYRTDKTTRPGGEPYEFGTRFRPQPHRGPALPRKKTDPRSFAG
jgi:hypothetical protein